MLLKQTGQQLNRGPVPLQQVVWFPPLTPRSVRKSVKELGMQRWLPLKWTLSGVSMLFNISIQQLTNVFSAMVAHFNQALTWCVFALRVINWRLSCLLTIRRFKKKSRRRWKSGCKKQWVENCSVRFGTHHIYCADVLFYFFIFFLFKNVPSVYILDLPKLFYRRTAFVRVSEGSQGRKNISPKPSAAQLDPRLYSISLSH